MFDIFVKREKVVIDFFCDQACSGSFNAFQTAKPDFSVKYFPDWFKKTTATYPYDNGSVTCPHTGRLATSMSIKTCPGVTDLYKQSITVPSWFVMEVDVDKEGLSVKSPLQELVSHMSHPNQQFKNFVNSDQAVNLKVDTPWIVQSKPNIQIMFVEPRWDNYNRYRYMTVLPGIMDLKYTNVLKINHLFDVPNDPDTVYTTRWDVLDPLVHIIPITDKEVEIKHHVVDIETMKKIKPTSDFIGQDELILKGPRWSYRTRKKLVDKLEKLDPKLWGDK